MSPECSPVALNVLPESLVSLAFAPFITVNVSPSSITPTSFWALGVSFTPVTVIVNVAVSVSVPSDNV